MYIDENFLEKIKNGENVFYLLEIINSNNDNLYLTTADIDIKIGDKIYKSGYFNGDIFINNLENTNGFKVQLLKDEYLIVEKILNANVIIKIATYEQSFIVFSGFVSQILDDNNLLDILILSKISKLNKQIGQLFSPICRECIGSKKCGLNMENYKTNGVVKNILSNDCFFGNHQINKKTPIGYYKYGLIKFYTGKLAGITMQLKDEVDGKIYLLRNTKLISIDDKYEIFAGCDKTLSTCKNKFNNVENFRGEPYINIDF